MVSRDNLIGTTRGNCYMYIAGRGQHIADPPAVEKLAIPTGMWLKTSGVKFEQPCSTLYPKDLSVILVLFVHALSTHYKMRI